MPGLLVTITGIALLLNTNWIRLQSRYRRVVNLRVMYMGQLENALKGQDVFVNFPPRIRESAARNTKPDVETPTESTAGYAQPLPEPSGIFAVEADHLYYGGSQFGFSGLDRALVIIFMYLYVVATIGVGIATYLVTTHVIAPIHL